MLLIIGEGGRRRSRITDMSSGTPDKSETSSGGALAATDSEAWAGTEAAGARAGGEHRTIGWVGFCEGDKGGDLPTATCFSNETRIGRNKTFTCTRHSARPTLRVQARHSRLTLPEPESLTCHPAHPTREKPHRAGHLLRLTEKLQQEQGLPAPERVARTEPLAGWDFVRGTRAGTCRPPHASVTKTRTRRNKTFTCTRHSATATRALHGFRQNAKTTRTSR